MPASTSARGLDHLVIGVRDLDAAGAFYEKLGFTVGRRNRHPWGTENRIVQFPGAFLELITVADASLIQPAEPRRYSFGSVVAEALARGEGMSMLVLESRDAEADASAFATGGIGDYAPFFFERDGTGPDGRPARVAFTLAFAADPAAPECGFFVCQQHEPQNFWNPAAQSHPNGAMGLAAAILLAEAPAAHRPFLSAFTGSREIVEGNDDFVVALPRGRIDVLGVDAAAAIYGVGLDEARARFVGFAVELPDLDALAERLEAAGISFQRHDDRLVVPPEAGLGCAIAFELA